MKNFMLSRPNSSFGSSQHSLRVPDTSTGISSRPGDTYRVPRTSNLTMPNILDAIRVAILSAGLLVAASSPAAESALPSKPQPQSAPNRAVQAQVDKQAVDAATEKRKKLIADATAAISQTQQALKALEDKKNDEAIKALAEATGKLELIVARDPKLALAPVSTTVVTYDLFASQDAVKTTIDEAKRAMDDGQIQKARALVEALGSEIQISTSSIPLATYPDAIKAITPLIDAGKIDEAKAQLQAALGTLVVTTEVIPLPKLRAENLLKDAQVLAEKNDRTKEENDKLAGDLKAAREQLQMAELLGYGKQKDYQPMYEQLDGIEKASAGGKSGTGWFDKIKKQLSDLF